MPLWAHDGQRIAFASNRRKRSRSSTSMCWIPSSPRAVPRLVAGGAGNRWRVFDWSLDDKRLLLGRECQATAQRNSVLGACRELFYIADVDSGEITAVGQLRADAGARRTTPAAAGNRQRQGCAAAALRVQDARFAHRRPRRAAADQAQRSSGQWRRSRSRGAIPAAGVSRFRRSRVARAERRRQRTTSSASIAASDGHYLAYTLNENGSSRLMLIDQQRKLGSERGCAARRASSAA